MLEIRNNPSNDSERLECLMNAQFRRIVEEAVRSFGLPTEMLFVPVCNKVDDREDDPKN